MITEDERGGPGWWGQQLVYLGYVQGLWQDVAGFGPVNVADRIAAEQFFPNQVVEKCPQGCQPSGIAA